MTPQITWSRLMIAVLDCPAATKEEALRIISETASRSKQHVGGKDN